MRIFKTKSFAKFCRKEAISDDRLLHVVAEIESGLVDAALGGDVYKKRIARKGQGKSGGFRTILCFRGAFRTVFILGFAKNDRGNIEPEELEDFKELATIIMAMTDETVEELVELGRWIETDYGTII